MDLNQRINKFNRFYSTYEELKLKNVNPAGPTIKKFLQYLWGIETTTFIKI